MFCFLALVAACSSSPAKPDAPKDVGFNKPTAGVHANTEVTTNNWMDLGPADLSCLNTTSGDQATTVEVTLNTKVADFQSGNVVPQAMVTAFDKIDYMHSFDTKMADANGLISFKIPAGTKRFGFKMTTDDGSTLPTFLLNQIVKPDQMVQTEPSKIQSVSMTTATTLPALIGETKIPGTGVIAGAMRDCNKHEMSNFVATVSSTSRTATPVAGAESFYFSQSTGIPVHHHAATDSGPVAPGQESSSPDGLFMVIQLPVVPQAYVQIWGFKTDADVATGQMTLLTELQAPVVADTVITGSYEPLRN
jgi:hypothetical protein